MPVESADRTTIVLDEDRVVIACKESGITAEEVARLLDLKLVHRIDRATSGLLLLARDARTVQRLQRALRDGEVERQYAFVAHGVVVEGTRESFLVRDRGDGLRGSGVGGKRSVAHIDACRTRDGVTHGRATLVTGRTHQLRIQLAEGGNPIVGERVYVRDALRDGLALVPSPRLLLHAERLRFMHPNNKRLVDVSVAPPFVQ